MYNFSNQIVVDITNLAVVVGETGGGRLSQKAWEDLQETRWAIGKSFDLTQMVINRIQGACQRKLQVGS